MPVDSFRFLPRVIAAYYQATDIEPEPSIPWTPLSRPLAQCTIGLVSSAGLYQRGVDSPFDLSRERAESTWGDPTFRALPSAIRGSDIGIAHLHINPADIARDVNIVLPVQRLSELVAGGEVGALAPKVYSFMGFQGFPPDTRAWREGYGPQVAQELEAQGADAVLLTPA